MPFTKTFTASSPSLVAAGLDTVLGLTDIDSDVEALTVGKCLSFRVVNMTANFARTESGYTLTLYSDLPINLTLCPYMAEQMTLSV